MLGPTVSATALTRVEVDGVAMEVTGHDDVVDKLLLPALERVRSERPRRPGRSYVFLVAPPGAGKSVLAALLVREARSRGLDVDAIGIDGFHLPHAQLERTLVPIEGGEVPLARFKGAPETFDTDGLDHHLSRGATEDIAWPVYDRNLHDVVAGSQLVTAEVVVVEGNWLLLDDPHWTSLLRHSSLNVFVDADRELLRRRLVDRKVRGGASRSEATDFYDRSDSRNVARVLEESDRSRVDLLLHLNPDGTIEQGVSA